MPPAELPYIISAADFLGSRSDLWPLPGALALVTRLGSLSLETLHAQLHQAGLLSCPVLQVCMGPGAMAPCVACGQAWTLSLQPSGLKRCVYPHRNQSLHLAAVAAWPGSDVGRGDWCESPQHAVFADISQEKSGTLRASGLEETASPCRAHESQGRKPTSQEYEGYEGFSQSWEQAARHPPVPCNGTCSASPCTPHSACSKPGRLPDRESLSAFKLFPKRPRSAVLSVQPRLGLRVDKIKRQPVCSTLTVKSQAHPRNQHMASVGLPLPHFRGNCARDLGPSWPHEIPQSGRHFS